MIVVMNMDHSESMDTTMKEEDLLENQGTQVEVEDFHEEKNPMVLEDHQMEEDHLMEEDPLMMEDCLMEMEDPHNILIEENPRT